MIIVKLKGGLGNQMFQYALGKKISTMRKTIFKLDKNFLEQPVWQKVIGVVVRGYELGEFNIKTQFAGFREKILAVPIREIPFHVKDNFKRIERTKGNLYLDGYWQSEEYFKDIKNVICRDFRLKNKSMNFVKVAKLISEPNSVSIHFRRGDYAEKGKTRRYHGLLGLDYYQKAISLVDEKVKDPHFFIFSDDSNWVKKNFKIGKPATYISGFYELTNAEELVLMSNCEHNIIANSSFSWWGAWLNNNPSKIVIAPTRWFRVKISSEEMLPLGWFKL